MAKKVAGKGAALGTLLLSISVVLQFVAAILAVRLIRVTGRAAAWVLIAGAITLMGIRRSITLFRALSHHSVDPDAAAEAVALLISVLMVLGVALIGRIFESVQASERLERRLAQRKKLEALGLLAGGVAHDFNNLLTVIRSSAEVMGPLDHESERARMSIEDASDRAARLTRQLLAFGRRQVLQPRAVSLSVVVREVESLLRSLLGETIELDLHLDDDASCLVFADPGQLEQVVVNLAVNARDAMPDGGKLLIRVAPDPSFSRLDGPQPPGWVQLSISDTGHGMSTETLQHIFEPFFSTRSHTGGTGLGLATVHGIVEQSNGEIDVESKEGKGTTFVIHLPMPDAAPEPVPEPPRKTEHGEGLVLVVEDQELVRTSLRALLKSLGYEVLDAADGASALELVKGREQDIRFVLSDMVMPGMSGADLSTRLRAIRPDLPVLIMSGYTADAEAIQASGNAFLPKPFSRADLVDAVARHVGETPPGD